MPGRFLTAWLVAPPVEIEWHAPPGCPDQAWLSARVHHFLDRPGVEATVEPVAARIEVAAEGSTYRAALHLRTGEREQVRQLADERCDVLAAAVAFIVAVAVDPDLIGDGLGEDRPEPDTAPPAAPPAPSAPAPEATPAPRAAETRRFPLRGALRVAGTGTVGLLPRFGPGVGLAGALLVGRARVELGGAWQFDRELALEGGGSARIRLWALEARGCFAPAASRVEFPLCGGVTAGSMRGESRGIAQPAVDAVAFVAARVGAGLAVVPSPYAAVVLAADAAIPLVRPKFTVENLGPVHQAAPVALWGQLGVEARFP